MILAAGLGTRLRPLTDTRPKALVEIDNRPLLEIALQRLRSFGVTDFIINVHHFADDVVAYLESRNNFGMKIAVSREDLLLDTGGGLKKAAWFFQSESGQNSPFILHNVDVASTIDLGKMVQFHTQRNALATLATKQRKTSRYLLFNEADGLCGRRAGEDGKPELVMTSSDCKSALAFCGIHVISPRLLTQLKEEGAFSIIDAYLRLASEGEKIAAYRADDDYWRDLGTVDNIRQLERDLQDGRVEL
jgi:mannose-1-phosphate guanylyltransferase